MKAKESFNQAAKLYDEVRPTYPTEVIEWVIKESGITLNDSLLEIAPGTGQATMRFGEKGYRVHTVELGDKLAEILIENCKDMAVTVDVSPFEEWDPKDKLFNMVYCATAFHWLDPEVKYKKIADMLEDNGYLVLLWNNAVGTDNKIINKAYELLFACYDKKVHSNKSKTYETIKAQKETLGKEIEDSGLFTFDKYYSKEWKLKQPKDRTIKGFYSQSSYLSLEESIKTELTKKLEALFEGLEVDTYSEFVTTAFVCKKIG